MWKTNANLKHFSMAMLLVLTLVSTSLADEEGDSKSRSPFQRIANFHQKVKEKVTGIGRSNKDDTRQDKSLDEHRRTDETPYPYEGDRRRRREENYSYDSRQNEGYPNERYPNQRYAEERYAARPHPNERRPQPTYSDRNDQGWQGQGELRRLPRETGRARPTQRLQQAQYLDNEVDGGYQPNAIEQDLPQANGYVGEPYRSNESYHAAPYHPDDLAPSYPPQTNTLRSPVEGQIRNEPSIDPRTRRHEQVYNHGPAYDHPQPQVYSSRGSASQISRGHFEHGMRIQGQRFDDNQMTATQRALKLEAENQILVSARESLKAENQRLARTVKESRDMLEEVQVAIEAAQQELSLANNENLALKRKVEDLEREKSLIVVESSRRLDEIRKRLDDVLMREISSNK